MIGWLGGDRFILEEWTAHVMCSYDHTTYRIVILAREDLRTKHSQTLITQSALELLAQPYRPIYKDAWNFFRTS